MIDHIDGNGRNNSIANLRDVSNSVNQHNQHAIRPDNKTGVVGVHFWAARGLFKATIKVDGVERHIGAFQSLQEAAVARAAAKAELHPESRSKT